MNLKQLEIMKNNKGFIAALDQSGGSTPKALKTYGVMEDEYSSDREMFEHIHKMRSRIITSPSFTSNTIIGVILFEETMYSHIHDMYSADYLWDIKKIVPFLKVDKGLEEKANGVSLMKEIVDLDKLLISAKDRNIFGTKMRSVIWEYDEDGIKEIIKQQFEIGKQIIEHGLVPILEPEVNIDAENKEEIEELVLTEIKKHLETLNDEQLVMFKLTPPSKDNLYKELTENNKVVRVVFLSGGYSQNKACELLAKNNNVVASFSRAFTEGLHVDMDDKAFDELIKNSANKIYQASST